MDKDQLARELIDKNGIVMPHTSGYSALRDFINDLINTDFNRLISLLYRMDIDEKQLKNLLQENKDLNAGDLIAGLMIKRHLKKMEDRNRFSAGNNESDEEKW